MESTLHPLKQSVAIIGANGYSGLELARILLKHPHATLKGCFVRNEKWQLGQDLVEKGAKQIPSLSLSDLVSMAPQFGAVFLATPTEISLELVPLLLNKTKVIDLSGAYRLSGGDFEKFYLDPSSELEGHQPAAQKAAQKTEQSELANQAHYGLVPWNQSKKGTSLVTNPGCFATSCLMALIPLLKNKLIDPMNIVIDSKSGTTGGGRKAKENLLFSEVEGDCLPYKIGVHQHLPEIKKYAELYSGVETDIQFTTHLLPVRRGIISSVYLKRNGALVHKSDSDFQSLISEAFEKAYAGDSLVNFGSVESNPKLLSLKSVVGSPRTHISFKVHGNKIFVFSCIDNLLKGAASQAIENWNILNLWPTDLGLDHIEGLL